MAIELCAACARPAQWREPLWYCSRTRDLWFAGWYGRACFYRVARAYAKDGFTVLREPGGRPVVLR